MHISILIQGLILGFSIAAPVGPIGVLCIRRSLFNGLIAGFISGFGAATADMLYECISGFGITFISDFLIEYQFYFKIFGAMYLFYLGIKVIFSKIENNSTENIKKESLFFMYLSTFVLTITNPMTILSFSIMFSSLGIIKSDENLLITLIFIIGVLFGSSLWWLVLSSSVSILKKKFNISKLEWINKASGTIIILFGVFVLLNK